MAGAGARCWTGTMEGVCITSMGAGLGESTMSARARLGGSEDGRLKNGENDKLLHTSTVAR